MTIAPAGLPTSGRAAALLGGAGGGGGTGWGRVALHAAAAALGMTTDDVRKALREGHSLASLSRARGSDPALVTGAVRDALTASGVSPERASRLAARYADSDSGHHLTGDRWP